MSRVCLFSLAALLACARAYEDAAGKPAGIADDENTATVVTGELGNPLLVHCLEAEEPTLFVFWYRGHGKGKLLKNNAVYGTRRNALLIRSLAIDTLGAYTCQAYTSKDMKPPRIFIVRDKIPDGTSPPDSDWSLPRSPWAPSLATQPPTSAETSTTTMTTTEGPGLWFTDKAEVAASEGGTVTLRCDSDVSWLQDKPSPKITWNFGELIIDGNAGRYRLMSDGALEIVSLYRNDTGVYICVADNSLGVVTQEIHLAVNDPERMPVGIAGDENAVVTGELGSPLEVRCLAYGYPPPSVFWYRGYNGAMVPYNDAVYLARGNILLIRRLAIETLGQYTCQAYNGEGKAASWVVFVRAYQPEGICIDSVLLVPRNTLPPGPGTQPPTTAETTTTNTLTKTEAPSLLATDAVRTPAAEENALVIGELHKPFQVCCPANGHAASSVEWYRSDERNTQMYNDTVYEPRGNVLLIRSLKMDNLGLYTCETNNGGGQTCSWKVLVQAYEPDGLLTKHEWLVPRETVAPSLGTPSLTTPETTTTTTTLRTTETPTLLVYDAMRTPAGEENAGVIGELLKPFQVCCPANGHAASSVEWYRSDERNMRLYNDTVYEPKENVLLIRSLKIVNLGLYTCEANNGGGQTGSWKVVVQAYEPDGLLTKHEWLVPRETVAPSLGTPSLTTSETTTITTTTILRTTETPTLLVDDPVRTPAGEENALVIGELHKPVQVCCPANGHAASSVEWYRSDERNTRLYNDTVYEPKGNVLLIRSLKLVNLGLYTCGANNGGSQTASWKVVVKAYEPDGLLTKHEWLVPRNAVAPSLGNPSFTTPETTTSTTTLKTTETPTLLVDDAVRTPAAEENAEVIGELQKPFQVCCPANGHAASSVEWYRSDERNTRLYNDTVYEPRGNVLLIRSLKIVNLGLYTCVANNGGGQTGSWKVVVQAYEPDGLLTKHEWLVPRETVAPSLGNPSLTTPETTTTTLRTTEMLTLLGDDSVTTPAGEENNGVIGELLKPLQVCCPANGHAASSVEWYRSDEKNTRLYNDTVYEPRGNVLLIRSLKIDNLGLYTCGANNGGSQTGSWKVLVQAYEPDGLLTKHEWLVPRDTVITTITTILRTTETPTLLDDDSVTTPAGEENNGVIGELHKPFQVCCPVNGHAASSVEWYRSDEKNTWLYNDTVYEPRGNVLLIKSLKLVTLGYYTCEANIGVGQMGSWKVAVRAYEPYGLLTNHEWLVPRDTVVPSLGTQCLTTPETMTTITLRTTETPTLLGDENSTAEELSETTENTKEASEVTEHVVRTRVESTSTRNTTNEETTDVTGTTTLDPCSGFEFGCCADNETEASGPDGQGCPCNATESGCCPDGVSPATDPESRCPGPCSTSLYGCCPDDKTPAQGPDFEGCCLLQTFGCRPDNRESIKGPNGEAACNMPPDKGPCHNFTVMWYYDRTNGGCSRFWYGGCEGNGNRFSTEEECKEVCAHHSPKAACFMRPDPGPCHNFTAMWFYDLAYGGCSRFWYGGCDGNGNRFSTKEECEEVCARHSPKDMPASPLPLSPQEPKVATPESGSPTLLCQFHGGPPPKITWEFGELTINGTAGHYRLMSDGALEIHLASGLVKVGFPGSCSASLYGCCQDGKMPAHGPDFEGCCLVQAFGCCPDNRKPAEGPHLEGCECKDALHGCCPDNVTIAQGTDNQGCGCQYTEHGCCPDRHTAASGPDYNGCACNTYQFGCCADGTTTAKGPEQQGCHCESDATRCTCSSSPHGCCPDGRTAATGPELLGCPDTPENKQAWCTQPQEAGNCIKKEALWSFSQWENRCLPFYYSGCGGNDNRFSSREACEQTCPGAYVADKCTLPAETGQCSNYMERWFYDTTFKRCRQFYYSGCGGNENNFGTEAECDNSCSETKTTTTTTTSTTTTTI